MFFFLSLEVRLYEIHCVAVSVIVQERNKQKTNKKQESNCDYSDHSDKTQKQRYSYNFIAFIYYFEVFLIYLNFYILILVLVILCSFDIFSSLVTISI